MSRVLLFTLTIASTPRFSDGDRPKCVKFFGQDEAAGRQYLEAIPFGDRGQPRAGWLVRCPNACLGRSAILKGAADGWNEVWILARAGQWKDYEGVHRRLSWRLNSRHTDEAALAAVDGVFVEAGHPTTAEVSSGGPRSAHEIIEYLITGLTLLGHAVLLLRDQVEDARRERDAVADLMDDDLDAASAEDGTGEVRGA